MTDNQKVETNEVPNTPKQETSTTVVLRIPKLNVQIVALGAIAIVTVSVSYTHLTLPTILRV